MAQGSVAMPGSEVGGEYLFAEAGSILRDAACSGPAQWAVVELGSV